MRIWKLMFVLVCFAGLTQLVWSQETNLNLTPGRRAHGIPGYLDPKTGQFTTRIQADEPAADQGSAIADVKYSVMTGTWDFSIAVTLKTTPQSGDLLICEVSLGTFDQVTLDYGESDVVAVTSPGSSATCNLKIPYSWVLTAPTTDTVSISYDVSLYHAYAVAGVPYPQISRHTDHTYSDAYKMPLNGATTNISITGVVL